VAPLAARLRPRCADEHLCLEAAETAVLDYLASPERFCPEKGDLGTYLFVAARCDLLNLLRREKRHKDRHVSLFSVEFGPQGGNLAGREKEPCELLCRGEEVAVSEEIFDAVAAECSEDERRILDLWRQGKADTVACATVLGISDRPTAEQERQAKRVKDRLKKRLQRRSA
jgi:DNA-directed RNA polymerase specialized sigma24 family protein